MPDLSKVHTLTVDTRHAGNRLDRYLAAVLENQSRSRLKALIEDGQVQIGGKVVTEANRRVKPDDAISVSIPKPIPMTLKPEKVALDIRYEDDDLLVVMKPAGMVVHPAPGHDSGTLVHALLAHCQGSLSGIGGVQRPGIVHRIDKDVSGLLVIAKHDRAHVGLAGQFTVHSVERSYDAIVFGVPSSPFGRIEQPIGRHPKDRKRQAIVKGGKPAVTDYKLVRACHSISHMRCTLMTGRTHQIRVHMTSIGHSLLGDPTYKPRRTAKIGQGLVTLVTEMNRIALHAAIIGFDHPINGERMRFEAAMPEVFEELLDADLH